MTSSSWAARPTTSKIADASVVGAGLVVDAGISSAGLTFDGSVETTGAFVVYDSSGNDAITTGGGGDQINLQHGGTDTVHAGGGDDAILANGTLTAADSVDGGSGNDTLVLSGDYSAGVTFGATTVVNVEEIDLSAGPQLQADHQRRHRRGRPDADRERDFAARGGHAHLRRFGRDQRFVHRQRRRGKRRHHDRRRQRHDQFVQGRRGHGTCGGGTDFVQAGGTLTAADTIDGGTGIKHADADRRLFGGARLRRRYGDQFRRDQRDRRLRLQSHHQRRHRGGGPASDGQRDRVERRPQPHLQRSAETDGSFSFTGSAGNDVLTGGAQNDTFNLTLGGNDFVHWRRGQRHLHSRHRLHPRRRDRRRHGQRHAGAQRRLRRRLAVLGAASMTNIDILKLDAGHSYTLYANDGNIAAGAVLTVDASALGAANTALIDGSSETNGSFAFIGGAGNDSFTGGAQNDAFNLTLGGNDFVHGGAGNDTFSFGGAFTAADTVDGGANTDTISLNGDYSAGLTLGATTITSIENIVIAAAGHSYNLTTVDANVASGATLTINATALGASDTLTFNGAAENDGHFNIIGGAGSDTLAAARSPTPSICR